MSGGQAEGACEAVEQLVVSAEHLDGTRRDRAGSVELARDEPVDAVAGREAQVGRTATTGHLEARAVHPDEQLIRCEVRRVGGGGSSRATFERKALRRSIVIDSGVITWPSRGSSSAVRPHAASASTTGSSARPYGVSS